MASDEVVHISLGETANHVTSHLLNLQGLAATASNASETSLCDPLGVFLASFSLFFQSLFVARIVGRDGEIVVREVVPTWN